MSETIADTVESAAPALEASAATARRSELLADAGWRGRYLDGSLAERNEMATLNATIAGPAKPDAPVDQSTIEYARQAGISDDIIDHHLVKQTPISQQEYEGAVRWRSSHLRDKAWVDKYLSGDIQARKEMTLANILVNSPIKSNSA